MRNAGDTGRSRANTSTKPSRRRVLTGAGVALATVAAVTSSAMAVPLHAASGQAASRALPASSSEDATLLALCAEFHRQHATVNAVPSGEDGELETALRARWELSNAIKVIPATSLAGIRAKAAVGAVLLDENRGPDHDAGDGDAAFAYAVLCDIAETRPSPQQPVPNSDAELLRLHAALVAQGAMVDRISEESDALDLQSGGGITPESIAHEARFDAADDLWFDLAEEIIDTPARTLLGMRAKADALRLVLERVVCCRIGQTVADVASGEAGEIEDRLAWSLSRDLLARDTLA